MTDATTTVEDIFNSEVPPIEEEVTSYVDSLVGEGKKFKTIEDLAKSKLEADRHIKDLSDLVEEEKSKGKTYQEILELLKKPAVVTTTEVVPNQPVDLEAIVEKKLNDKEAKKIADANTEASLTELYKLYGSESKGKEALKKAGNNDKTIQDMLALLGSKNPQGFVDYVKSQVPPGSVTTIVSTPGVDKTQSPSTTIRDSDGLTWTQATEIRKTDPRRYNSASFRKELNDAAAKATRLGKDFFKT